MPVAILVAAALAWPSLPPGPLAAVLVSETDGEQSRRAFDEALAALRLGDLAAAVRGLETAVRLVPDWALAHLELGIARLTVDPQDGRAVVELESAVRLAPGNPRARLQLGLAYARQGRAAEAQASLRAALAARADLLEARYALAECLADEGAWPEALAEYRQVTARDPGNVGALAGLASAAERAGDLAAAESALVGITHLLPAVPYHRYRLAEFYERTGQAAKATRIYADLETADPRQRRLRKLK
jgi:tetratricopeptide (TPR) repeat protein